MKPVQNIKCQIAINRQTTGTAGITGNTIDVKGFDTASFVVIAQAVNTTAVPASFSFEHADDTNTASFVAFHTISSGLPTSIDSTALTNHDAFANITVDLRGKKRYIRLKTVNSIATTNLVTAICLLDEPAYAPVTPAQSGLKYVSNTLATGNSYA
jgi:hypothetical protein